MFQRNLLRNYLTMPRNKVSVSAEVLIKFCNENSEFDPTLNADKLIPTNPWISDETTYWLLNQPM